MNLETPIFENLSDRLNYALKFTGTKKADLARAISVKPQVIQFLCSSKTLASRFTFEIATVLGLNIRWLATGEGAMFIADDPKQQFLQTYKRIPLLTTANIRDIFLYEKSIDQESIDIWLPLITDNLDTVAIKMLDTSMEPLFPINSNIFIKKCLKENFNAYKYFFAYLVKFDTFVIRELIEVQSEKFLFPKNRELFKEIRVTDEIQLLGVVTDCFWHIRS